MILAEILFVQDIARQIGSGGWKGSFVVRDPFRVFFCRGVFIFLS